jgi:hypothetical protein
VSENAVPNLSFNPDLQIVSVEFGDGYEYLDVTYIERHGVAPQAIRRASVQFTADLLNKEELGDVIDSLEQFLDAALLHIRNEGGPE